MLFVLIQKLRLFINLPEDNLSIKSTCDNSVLTVSLHIKDCALMAVMRVHVRHFSDIPHFHAPICRNRIKLIIFSIKLYSCDSVAMAHKCLNLLLIVNIPNSDNSVFTSCNHELSILRDSHSERFVEMARQISILVLLTFEN